MSILGVGTDIVAVGRMRNLLERHEDRFLLRCFSPAERTLLENRSKSARAAAFAARWAAKEAFLKALGGAISHIPYHEISIETGNGGAPHLRLEGLAAAALRERGGRRSHVSLSHEVDFAVATVVVET